MEKENDNEDMEKGGGDYLYIYIFIYVYQIISTIEKGVGEYIYIHMMKLSMGIFGIFGYSNKVSALAFPSVQRPDVKET